MSVCIEPSHSGYGQQQSNCLGCRAAVRAGTPGPGHRVVREAMRMSGATADYSEDVLDRVIEALATAVEDEIIKTFGFKITPARHETWRKAMAGILTKAQFGHVGWVVDHESQMGYVFHSATFEPGGDRRPEGEGWEPVFAFHE